MRWRWPRGSSMERAVATAGGRVEAPRAWRMPSALGLGALESWELRRAAEQSALAAEGRLLVVPARLASMEGRSRGREWAAAALRVDCAAMARELRRQEEVIAVAAPELKAMRLLQARQDPGGSSASRPGVAAGAIRG